MPRPNPVLQRRRGGALRKVTLAIVPLSLAVVFLLLQASPAAACGSLLAPNGAIRLARAATLVEWRDGVEHYMTSFTYHGDVSNLGWIVPLPAVPEKIEEGGGWTLQRLVRETHPVPKNVFLDAAAPEATASGAQVLQQVRVQALDITVVKGSGEEIVTWARENGFAVDTETRAHLLVYAKGSPIFMAAKYDTTVARARGQLDGDGAPVLITMRTPHLWIPLEVLSINNPQVLADLYLLTASPLYANDLHATIGQSSVGVEIPGASGLRVAYQQKISSALYRDLSTDKNMGWIRADSWLTYLSMDAPGKTVTYDLGVSPSGVIRLAPYGTSPMAVVDRAAASETRIHLPLGAPQMTLLASALLALAAGLFIIFRRTKHAPNGARSST